MNKFATLAFVTGAMIGVANAQVNHFYFYDVLPSTTVSAPAGSVNTAAGAGITRLTMDDLAMPAYLTGQTITRMAWAQANLGTNSVSSRPRLRWWAADGTTVGPTGVPNPGNYFGSVASHGQGATPPTSTGSIGFTFNPITQNAASGGWYAGDSSVANFRVPPVALSTIWMGITWDNAGGSTATSDDLNQMAIYLGNPYQIVGSTNAAFTTTSPGSFFNVNNPVGSQFQFGGANPPVANFAFALAVAGQVLTGTFNLQDTIFAAPGLTRRIFVTAKQGTTVISQDFFDATSSATSFTMFLPAIITGDVTLEFDGASFLKKNVTATVAGTVDGTASLSDPVALQNGDSDASGEVDAADIDLVIADFGGTGTNTDVDVSGEVDAADIDIVIANFGGFDN